MSSHGEAPVSSDKGDQDQTEASSTNVDPTPGAAMSSHGEAPVSSDKGDQDQTEASVTNVEPTPGAAMSSDGQPTSSSTEAIPSTPENTLMLEWSFGFKVNKGSGGVKFLSASGSEGAPARVFYALAHTGVIYDHTKKTQMLLQGHCNSITASCVSQDGRWVVTADAGNDSMLIVWSATTGSPVRTIFEPHAGGGTCALDISGDGKYLVTMGVEEEREEGMPPQPQEVKLWDWAGAQEEPLHTTNVPTSAHLDYVAFNSERYELVFNGVQELFFAHWDTEARNLAFVVPELLEKTNSMTITQFVPGTSLAATGTHKGELIIWSDCNKAIKTIQLHDSAIHAISCTNGMIATGSAEGHVRIYDQHCRILHWFDDINNGSIVSLAMPPVKVQNADYAPPLVIGTGTGAIYSIHTNAETEEPDIDLWMQGQAGAVQALEAHPYEPLVAIGGHQGDIQLINYLTKEIVRTFRLDKGLLVQTLRFNPDGKSMAIGTTNGTVKILYLDPQEGSDMETFRPTTALVNEIIFSQDSKYFATADDDSTVSLFKLEELGWTWVGKHRSHTKGVAGMLFQLGRDSEDDATTLLSVGGDRYLVEYDLEASSITKGLLIRSRNSIDQSARPTAFFAYPYSEKESFIAMASDSYKIKLFNAKTKMCRRTILGPTYGCPLQDVVILPATKSLKDFPLQNRFLIYNTGQRVIGVIMLPLEGNPHKSMALIAHPGKISSTSASYDGRYIFTVGGEDGALNMWKINTACLEATENLGGAGLEPFLGLLEGGRDGALLKEFEDFFYYAQIKAQGEDFKGERRVSSKVPLEQVANIMRGMGFYPTEEHINDMLNEVKFMRFVETKESVTEITMEELVRLYLNHRPVEALCEEDITEAMSVLGNESGKIAKDELMHLLKNSGEYMTEEELAGHLDALLGEGGIASLPNMLSATSITTKLLKLA